MRWPVLVVAIALFALLDSAFTPILQLGDVRPLLTASLAVFVCLLATRTTAWIAMVAIGLILDFSGPEIFDQRLLIVPGPWALGCLFGGAIVVLLRPTLVRRNPLTIAVMAVLFLIAASLVWTACWSARSWYPGSVAPWGEQRIWWVFGRQIRWALWSGAVALPVGWLLLRTLKIWGLPGGVARSRR